MFDTHALIAILIMAGVTAGTRFLPFLLFPRGRNKPRLILYLSQVLPTAVIGMLVIYVLKDVTFSSISGFLPELIAIAVVIALHAWKKQPLISIGGGTVCYMLLVQQVF
ncbi:MAG TPA: branched-chain amino acid transporter AzlD [Fastidiosipila sp.]|nr:branched-chain amino acid transporter AzlD [Fastidiosipila sp.]